MGKKKTEKKKKKKLPKISTLKNRITKRCNAYIKHRDTINGKFTCISCLVEKELDQFNAGHYVPVRGREFLRFNEWNINGECIACNRGDEFHLIRYRRNLIDKIGLDAVLYLERNEQNKKKFNRQELNEIEDYYKSITNRKGNDEPHKD